MEKSNRDNRDTVLKLRTPNSNPQQDRLDWNPYQTLRFETLNAPSTENPNIKTFVSQLLQYNAEHDARVRRGGGNHTIYNHDRQKFVNMK
jgi:hypothetical protein